MKILIYEEWSHFIPTGYSWAKGLLKLGYEVSHYNPSKIKLSNISEKDFELIIHFDIPIYSEYEYELNTFKSKNPHTKIIGVGFPREVYNKYIPYIDGWVMNVYKYPSATKLFNELGFKSYNVSLASHPDLFFPIDAKKEYDFSFIGQLGIHGHGYKHEDKYLYPFLDNDKYKCITYGFSYKNIKRTHILYDQINPIYNKTKINLNFHYDVQQNSETDKIDFNGRLFDIALSNNFQLVNHKYLSNIFESYNLLADETNWVEVAEFYLNNEHARIELSNKMYTEAINKHTWKIRMEDFINNFIRKL